MILGQPVVEHVTIVDGLGITDFVSVTPVPTDLQVSHDRDGQHGTELLPERSRVFHGVLDDGQSTMEIIVPDLEVDRIVYETQAVTRNTLPPELGIDQGHGE